MGAAMQAVADEGEADVAPPQGRRAREDVTGQAMLLRRRGRVYVASEWQLARLKHRLHFQAALPALYYFALRALPRLLPAGLLGHVYRILRRR